MTMNTNANAPTNNAGIHNGAVTHHQLQSILSVNFNTMNMRNRIIPKPIPFDELLLLLIFLIYTLIYKISFAKPIPLLKNPPHIAVRRGKKENWL